MNKEKIEVSISVYDIPIVIETLEKADSEIKKLREENQQLKEMQCPFLGTGCKRELEQLKKQKDDVVEYIKKRTIFGEYTIAYPGILNQDEVRKILRMLGEIDD